MLQRMVYKHSALFILVLMTLLFLTLKPSDGIPEIDIPHLDKAVHAFFFLILSYLLMVSLDVEVKLCAFTLSVWTTVLVLVLLGVGIELLQVKIPGRSASFADAFADFLGIALGVGIYYKRREIKRGS